MIFPYILRSIFTHVRILSAGALYIYIYITIDLRTHILSAGSFIYIYI
jgi:hypothetical protein